jgi:hypothetical protein
LVLEKDQGFLAITYISLVSDLDNPMDIEISTIEVIPAGEERLFLDDSNVTFLDEALKPVKIVYTKEIKQGESVEFSKTEKVTFGSGEALVKFAKPVDLVVKKAAIVPKAENSDASSSDDGTEVIKSSPGS